MTTDSEPTFERARPQHTPRTLMLILGIIALCVVLADQVTKKLAQDNLVENYPQPVIGDLVQFNLHYNSGAAFSMANGLTGVLTIVACAVVVVIIRISRKLGSTWWAMALGLLVGGAMGNLVDRFFRYPGPGRGWVVDFIHVQRFAIFNVADIAISCAAILIIVLALRGIGIDGVRATSDRKAVAEANTLSSSPAFESEARPFSDTAVPLESENSVSESIEQQTNSDPRTHRGD